MAYKYNFTPTDLNYETETPYITGFGKLRDDSYNRTWWFRADNNLTVSKGSNQGAKLAFYLPPEGATGTTTKLRLISTNYIQDEGGTWAASGSASLQSSALDIEPEPVWVTRDWYGQNYTFNVQDYGNYRILEAQYKTNIPVFSTYNDALNYINDLLPITSALNYLRYEEPENAYFEIFNTAQKDTWTLNGKEFVDGPYYRWVKIKISSSDIADGRIAFYREGLYDGAIRLNPVITANIISCEYSTTGGAEWTESVTFPFDYIYGERENELGTFISATRTGISGDNGVPVFDTLEEATGWVNHDPSVDISQALNYADIANRYKITNPTGAEETGTIMGDGSYLRNYFSQEYVCSQNAITEISNDFFDTGAQGIWESIAEGLPMMGSNPIDCVCGLKWFPYDLSDILSGLAAPQNYIYFGGYQYQLPSANVRKVVNHGGYKSLGSFTIHDAFPNPNDFRNFEPWCRLKIYIPTVGIQDLSYNKYRGKTTEVRLYVDIKSGNTLIALLADGVLYDYFNGSSGVDIPITLTDKAELAQAQLRNISNLAGVGINMGTAAVTANPGAAAAGVANFASAMNELNSTSADQFNVTKGGSSPMGNGCFLPNYVYLIFEYIKTAETPNLNQLAGRASNRSGNLNSFSGYLEVDEITLVTSAGMTEKEKQDFINLLHQGIII